MLREEVDDEYYKDCDNLGDEFPEIYVKYDWCFVGETPSGSPKEVKVVLASGDQEINLIGLFSQSGLSRTWLQGVESDGTLHYRRGGKEGYFEEFIRILVESC